MNMTSEQIHEKAIIIATKLELRPPIVFPKGTIFAPKNTILTFIKEIEGTFESGVYIYFEYKDDKFILKPKNPIIFRNDNFEVHTKLVDILIKNILTELNTNKN